MPSIFNCPIPLGRAVPVTTQAVRSSQEFQKLQTVIRLLTASANNRMPGVPFTLGFFAGAKRVAGLPNINPDFDSQLEKPAQYAYQSGRTDESLNTELARAGAAERVFIRQPAGPMPVLVKIGGRDGTRIDLFQRDAVCFGLAEQRTLSSSGKLFIFSDEAKSNLAPSVEAVREGTTMMISKAGVKETLRIGKAVAFGNAAIDRVQQQATQEALGRYTIKSGNYAPVGENLFISDRIELLTALMQAEAELERVDHSRLTSRGPQTCGTAVLDDSFQTFYQQGAWLSRILAEGHNVLADLRKIILDLHVLRFILVSSYSSSQPGRSERMRAHWRAFGALVWDKDLMSQPMSLRDIEPNIEKYRVLADLLTAKLVQKLNSLPWPEKAYGGALEMSSQANFWLGYSLDWMQTVEMVYKYNCLSQEDQTALNSFLNEEFLKAVRG